MALYLNTPFILGGVHTDYEGRDTREQVTGRQRNLQNVEFKTVLLHYCYHDKQWIVLGRASRMRELVSRVVWWLNVWTREVATGRTLNDRSFTLHSNLITWWARHVVSMWKMREVPVHAMKAYGRRRDIAPLILNLGCRRSRVVNLTPRMLYPGIQRIGKWVCPRAGSNVLHKRKTLAPAEIRTPDDPSISLIAVPTELSRLLRQRQKLVQNRNLKGCQHL